MSGENYTKENKNVGKFQMGIFIKTESGDFSYLPKIKAYNFLTKDTVALGGFSAPKIFWA